MTTKATPRLLGSVLVGVGGLFASIVLQRAEPAVVAAPFLVVAAVALAGLRPPDPRVRVDLGADRLLQDEELTLDVTLVDGASSGRARVRLALPPGVELVEGPASEEIVVRGADPVVLSRRLRVAEWGAVPPVGVSVTTTDRVGAFTTVTRAASSPLRVMPREAQLREVLSPRSLRTIPGVHRSRQRGDGIEFADTRVMVPGDRARDVNWRVSARHQELWVDDRLPERSGEVVLFLDSFVSIGDERTSTLRRAVEVAGALASRHISANDRVGLVDLGGVFRWVKPGGGTAQLYRIVEALVDTEVLATAANKTIDVFPVRALPRQALVVALTPLVDRQGIEAIATMRARGFDVAVIEIPPGELVPPPPGRRGELAHRLWELERHQVREDLRSRGIAVAGWEQDMALDQVMTALGVFREAVLRAAR